MKFNQFYITILCLIMVSCIPAKETHHGYNLEYLKFENIKHKLDNKESVIANLGNPSTRSSFGQETWYYINYENKKYAFLDPEQENNTIITIAFDAQDNVSDLSIQKNINFNSIYADSDITPTSGTKKNFLQRFFSNLGYLPAGQQN